MKETTKKAAAAAAAAAKRSVESISLPCGSMSDFNIHDGLTVHPTVLNIPFELNKEGSCSFQLTNKMDRIVAYQIWPSGKIILLAPDDPYKYVGAILPRSTSTVTVTVKLTPEPVHGKERINIWACVVKDGVKAEDITKENLYGLTKARHESFTLPVVCYYTVPAANSSSTVPKENENGSLFDDNNFFFQSITGEVHKTTSKGKVLESSFRRQTYNEMPSIVLFSDDEIKGATNGLSDSSKIGQGGYGAVYKGNLHDTEVAIKMLDPDSQQGMAEFLQEVLQMNFGLILQMMGDAT